MKKLQKVLCVLLLLCVVCVSAAAVDAATVATVNGTIYTDLTAALGAVDAQNPEQTVVVLEKAVDVLTVETTTYLDLNGFDIASVDVESGATLYCLDSETDDYVVSGDAENGYTGFGRIAAFDGKVAPVEAGMIPVVASEEYRFGTLDGYLMVEDTEGTSFHRVNLQITAMTLRPKNNGESAYNPGIYYKSNFAGDRVVADNVDTFGIALSIKEMPTAENMGLSNQYSWFTADQFRPGTNNGDATSTLLKSVLKENNSQMTNSFNAGLPIFGRAYLQTTEGQYIFGVGVDRTLKEQMEQLSADRFWNPLDDSIKQTVTALYKTYKSVMKKWDVQSVKDAYMAEEDKVLRILNISNSHGQDAVWLIPTVLNAEMPELDYMIAECYFSGALPEHLDNAYNNARVYNYYTNVGDGWTTTEDVTIAYALEQEHWDYVMFNESSRYLGLERYMSKDLIGSFQKYIDENLDYEPKFLYDMTWSNPNDDRFHDPATADGIVRRKAVEGFKNTYTAHYGYDYVNHFNFLVEKTEQYLLNSDGTAKAPFDKVIWNATPIQYAQVRPDEENRVPQWDTDEIWDLYRDYTHLSDFGRLIVAYQFYAQFFEVEEIDAVNVDVVAYENRSTWGNRHLRLGDLAITDDHKQVIMDCVNFTQKDPLMKTLTTTPVIQDGASEFVIVHDGTEGAIKLANAVKETITARFGITLEVAADVDLGENSVRQEIVIGNARGIGAKVTENLPAEFDFAVEARGNKLLLCAKNSVSFAYLTEYVKREVLVADESGNLILDTDDNIVYSQSELTAQNFIDYCQAENVTYDRDQIFSAAIYQNEDTTLPYRLYVPFNYSPDKSYALMVSLHGAGHRGDNNSSQLGQLMKLMSRSDVAVDEVIVLAPQCPSNQKWVDTDWSLGSYSLADTPESNEIKAVMEILGQLREKYNVDAKRIYASGYSMGGYGTWNLLMNHSDVFCAAVAMCGAADPSQAATLVDVPVWAIHGVKDPTVPVSGSQEMVAAIQAAGGTKVRYTELPDHEHDVWSYTYTDPEIFNWLFSQVKE